MIRFAPLLGLLFLLAASTAAFAQDSTLDRVQNLVATGRFTDARSALAEWERRFADPRSSASSADRARALYLRGTLAGDPKEAEDAFIAVVLSYPSSAVAPGALLRLGQGLLTAGEPRRALAYLERLHSDYPGTPQRETGWVWLARAQLATGSPAAACATARSGVDAVRDANLRTLIELERDQACARTGAQAAADEPARTRGSILPGEPAADPEPAPIGVPPTTAAGRTVMPGEPAADPEPSPARTERDPTRAKPAVATPAHATPASPRLTGDFAVQSAAFRERSSAEIVAAHLRERGFDARVTLVANSPLHRVRVGAFTSNADAAALAHRIRDAGYTAVIVSDVQREL
jgi:cell division protein FtsN